MKDFLSILDFATEEIWEIFELADRLKYDASKPLAGKTVAMIFQKPSLRTRVSFEAGVVQLGGHPVCLSQESIGLGKRESVADVARVLSRYNDLIVARVFEHDDLIEMARHASVPVINALSDLSHPCQVLADAYTMRQRGKLFEGAKVVFVGDGNNVANSWLELAARLPIHFVLASPKGYAPNAELLRIATSSGVGKVEIVHNPQAAVWDADVVYGDVWTSMGQEAESETRKRDFASYQINADLMRYAKPDAIFMHCLPARRGEEVTDEVIDSPQSVVFDQAENRLHVQKAIMAKLVEQHYAPAFSPTPKAKNRKKR
ncbi:MAG: ornithine carbamoyltransferase [Chloroherpetonaceae bacterium]|nr:ornithine carbamoyltransferase [Chloroherpetonaceae bacterium]MDW8438589.1 ornithine carbamoyltransferase [Chloroherpetonaceae bacterium]